MNALLLITFVFLGIAALFVQWKQTIGTLAFLNLLSFAAIGLWFNSYNGESVQAFTYGLVGIAGINFVLARIRIFRKPLFRLALPVLTFLVYFWFFGSENVAFLGEEYALTNKFLIAGTAIALLGYEFAQWKWILLKKLFSGVEEEVITRSVRLLFLSLSLFLAVFGAGAFGVLVVTAGFLVCSFYQDEKKSDLIPALLIVSVLPLLMTLNGNGDALLLGGDVLFGLFLGVFGAFFLTRIWEQKKNNWLLTVIAYLIVLGFSFGLLFVGSVYSKMGGMDAYVAVLLGLALASTLLSNSNVVHSIFSFLIVGGVLLPTLMVNEELEAFEKSVVETNNSDVEGENEKPVIKSLDELSGEYTIDPANSNVQFFLGQKDETKGAFKKIQGSVSVDENGNASFDIVLNVKDLTTFNKFRDESLYSDEYFHVDKFPEMTYNGKSTPGEKSNEYEIDGTFTMLGVSKVIRVSLQRTIVNGKSVLVGGGKMDRTLFGMTPSSTEGNVVTFTYRAALQEAQ